MISLLLPTRGRPALARRFLDSVVDRSQRIDDVEVVIYVDDDDPDSHAIDHPRVRIHRIIGPDATMGVFNTRCLAAASGSIIMLVNDDVIVRTGAWDERLRDLDARYSDGVYLAYPNDQFKKRRVATFPILSRRACDLLSRPYPAEYHGGLIDYHLLDVFKRLGRLGADRVTYLHDVVFEHVHYRTGKSEFDQTYRRRSRFGDDEVFIALRAQRQSAARRLAAALAGQPLPMIAPAAPLCPPRAWPRAVARYARVFLGDDGLPGSWRSFLFAWYCGRHLAAHGWRRPASPQTGYGLPASERTPADR